ncbi:MAG: thiamine-phosphate kinase [Candidatus Endonucleobacter sp. (ex Gigantidas childressi)]|nr:thiamine-phosphate kinase [Candidatus Endonucleobacter sp. (ex Gigantidas childressi)]
MIGEFELIKKYFHRAELAPSLTGVTEVGDDCALLEVPSNMQLAQSIDTLVEGVHFPFNCDPKLLGYRALAVSLSDLAAMGASAYYFMLGLTMPEVDKSWLEGFSDGLSAVSQQEGVALIGGDTTCGPLTISIQVQGFIKKGKALKRSSARAGDKIYVSGSLGDSAGALSFVLEGQHPATVVDKDICRLLNRYYKPTPRLALGQWLGGNGATSAIDISDGLLGDLQHILTASHKGATLNPDIIPCSDALIKVCGLEQANRFAMTGGDDYELCFTWPENKALMLPEALECTVSHIGHITKKMQLVNSHTGNDFNMSSYTHF